MRDRPVLRWLSAIVGQPVPERLGGLLDFLLLLLFVHTLAGALRAWACKEAKGPAIYLRFITGFAQVMLILLAGLSLSIMIGHWTEFLATVVAVLALESLSILRTALVLQQCGGMQLGPLQPYLDRLTKQLRVGIEPPEGERSESSGTVGKVLPMPQTEAPPKETEERGPGLEK